MAKLKLIETIQSKLSTLTKKDGQLIVVRDNASLHIDLDGNRIYISDWIDISTDEERLAMISPLSNKYYYVVETNKIWRYISGSWVLISSIKDLNEHIEDTNIHINPTERTNWNSAKTHANSTHARTDATKVEKSSTNGNIKINGSETVVYVHPSGTNPHNITKSDVGLGNVENKSSATIRGEITSSNITTALGYTPLNSNLKGSVDGLAELDSTGKVPTSQLPSYVDDVLEYTAKSGFPTTGETGKIYVDTSTNLTYRWSGSAYVEISPSLALGTTSSTAYRGDRGNIAYTHSQSSHAPSDAEKNQNAFSNVTVGSTTIAADTVTDTLTLVAGGNVTLTPDATNDKITIAATDTVYTHPDSGVTAGNYAGVTVDAQGHVTAGSTTLPISKGGTGQTTIANIYKNVICKSGENTSPEYVVGFDTSYANNGYVSIKDLRNTMGLGNTTDALSITNGGTGATDATTALNNLGAATVNHTHSVATTSTNGLMTSTDKTKLDSIAEGANKYTHPNYTARTGVPTANASPGFGGTFKVSQPVSDATGHITAINSRTITIPNAIASTSANGLMSSTDKSKLDNMDAYATNIPFITGTQTATTGTWTGTTSEISSLVDGQTIRYWLPYKGSGEATLNLTLSDGTTTGAIACYWKGTTRLTTHYAAGTVITLTYRANISIAGSTTTYTGWWADADYDSNSDTKVTQTVTTTNANYPLLLAPSGQTATKTTTSYFASGVTLNPSTNTIEANISGNATTATSATSATSATTATTASKLSNTSAIGSATNPVYFNASGVPVKTTYTLGKSVPSNAIFTDTTYSQATSSALGLVKIGFTESGKNYPVELNSSGQMYVNVPWTDNNTTYSDFVKSGSSAKAGLVPAPSTTAGTTKYLREDGTWAVPPDNNTTYSTMTGASSSAAGVTGLVPAPAKGKQASFLRGDGTWVVPTNTWTKVSTSADGYVTKLPGNTTTFLRGDGTWATPPDTNTTYTLSSFGITATATELNTLDGITATVTELNYCDGVTSNIQTQLDAKQATITGGATTITSSNLTASRALISNSSGKVAVSAVTSTELGYLDGVTSSIQTQLDGKAASSHGTHVSFSTTKPVVAGTASVGSATTVSRSDHVHPAQTSVTGSSGSCTGNSATATSASSSASTVTTSCLRNIQASTTDLTAGTSSLTTGAIYIVYE